MPGILLVLVFFCPSSVCFVFLTSYDNMLFNQPVHVFSLDSYLRLKCYPDQGNISVLENWWSSCLITFTTIQARPLYEAYVLLIPYIILFSKFQAQIGYNFTLLDIGGGFPGAPDAAITFEEVSFEI